MNINSLSSSLLSSQLKTTQNSQQSLAASTMKNAMNSPKQFLDLLEQSINVKNTIQLADKQGIGTNVDLYI